jgi:hypothetical protein
LISHHVRKISHKVCTFVAIGTVKENEKKRFYLLVFWLGSEGEFAYGARKFLKR